MRRDSRDQLDGHAIGLTPEGSRQESVRIGSLRRRTWKRVYEPISRFLETRTCKVRPAGRKRGNRRKVTHVARPRVDTTIRLADRAGQRGERQVTLIRAPVGALTASCVILTPERRSLPRIRTVGNGYMIRALAEGGVIVIVSAAM